MTTPSSALAAIWATLPASMTTSQKLSTLNDMKVAGPAQNCSRNAIKAILMGAGVLGKMQAYVTSPDATQPCLIATNYLLTIVDYEAAVAGDVFPVSEPANLALIQDIAPNLLSDPANGMTQNDLDRIMALITPLVPWWQANGFSSPVLVNDLIAAGNLY